MWGLAISSKVIRHRAAWSGEPQTHNPIWHIMDILPVTASKSFYLILIWSLSFTCELLLASENSTFHGNRSERMRNTYSIQPNLLLFSACSIHWVPWHSKSHRTYELQLSQHVLEVLRTSNCSNPDNILALLPPGAARQVRPYCYCVDFSFDRWSDVVPKGQMPQICEC